MASNEIDKEGSQFLLTHPLSNCKKDVVDTLKKGWSQVTVVGTLCAKSYAAYTSW